MLSLDVITSLSETTTSLTHPSGATPVASSSRTAAPPQAAASFIPGAYPSFPTASNADDVRYRTTTSDPVPLPASSAPPPDRRVLSHKVKKLVDMGFAQLDVEAALEACQGNENLAISHLLSSGVDSVL